MNVTMIYSYLSKPLNLMNIALLPVLQNPFDLSSFVPPTLQNSVCSHADVSLQVAVILEYVLII